MKNQYIKYQELIRRNQFIDNLKNRGVSLIFKKNKVKICLGGGCVVMGFITLPLPTGSIFLIGVGCMLLEFNKLDMFIYKEKFKRQVKRFLR